MSKTFVFQDMIFFKWKKDIWKVKCWRIGLEIPTQMEDKQRPEFGVNAETVYMGQGLELDVYILHIHILALQQLTPIE